MSDEYTKTLQPDIPLEAQLVAKMVATMATTLLNKTYEGIGVTNTVTYPMLVRDAYRILDLAIEESGTRQQARFLAENKRRKGY